jgi:hypothetical protein
MTAAVAGSGSLTAGIDAYGDVVDLRVPGPAGRALIDDPYERQLAGTVPSGTGVVPVASIGGRPALPLWRADSVRQRYVRDTNVLITEARFGHTRVSLRCAAVSSTLACVTRTEGPAGAVIRLRHATRFGHRVQVDDGRARQALRTAIAADRRWLGRARRLGPEAPRWARRLYARSLLALRALSDRADGAVAAGARDGWGYVWPRDAAAVSIALASAGYRPMARRAVGFLRRLDLDAAARFAGDGAPVPGRAAQGDAAGWVRAAERAAGLPSPALRWEWRGRADYQEGSAGDYLGNALAAAYDADGLKSEALLRFSAHRRLVRVAGDPRSGLDSAAAWAVRPFALRELFPAARRTLTTLARGAGRYGIVPSRSWPGSDPWTAPTAWTAWSLAALGDRRQALRLLADLRRAATPAGLLPERVDAADGVPRSTTPLAWSHAFTILALRLLWPGSSR